MITVTTDDGDREYPDATRYSTDEYNNLCIWGGRQADQLLYLFAVGRWKEVGVDDSS